jgi:hypothetical protein
MDLQKACLSLFISTINIFIFLVYFYFLINSHKNLEWIPISFKHSFSTQIQLIKYFYFYFIFSQIDFDLDDPLHLWWTKSIWLNNLFHVYYLSIVFNLHSSKLNYEF